jgi:hypothetical protein
MSRGRPKLEIVLDERERDQLEAWTRRRKTAQALALRARIILECATGMESKGVTQRVSVSQNGLEMAQPVFRPHPIHSGILPIPPSDHGRMALGLSGAEFEAHRRLAPVGLKTPVPKITQTRPLNKKNALRCGFLPSHKPKFLS